MRKTESGWRNAHPELSHSYITPALFDLLGDGEGKRLLDLGCGNGSLTARFVDAGYAVTGAEHSKSGLEQAQDAFPAVTFIPQDINQPFPQHLRSSFDVMVAVEVIEHLWFPRELFERASEVLKPGGKLIITTPFHGYWKNLALALTNKFDNHWHPWEDFGHVKFFSEKTLAAMANEKGFRATDFRRVGRIPFLAKSMILVCETDTTLSPTHDT